MEQMNIRIERQLVREVDSLVGKGGAYHNRSDFIRSAIRAQVIEERKHALDKIAIEMAKTLRERGMTPEKATLPTRKERDELFEEFARKKGLK